MSCQKDLELQYFAGHIQEHAQTFQSVNSPIWCEASICESSMTPFARPIGILHSKESTVGLLLKEEGNSNMYSSGIF